jgi:hypothetical protein
MTQYVNDLMEKFRPQITFIKHKSRAAKRRQPPGGA